MQSSRGTNAAPAPLPPSVTSTRTALLSTAKHLLTTSGNAFDGYIDNLLPIPQAGLHHGQTLYSIEESGGAIARPVPEKILAQENILTESHTDEGTIEIEHDRMFVKWQGKSILRASWVDAQLWRELRPGHVVRDEWQTRKEREEEFDMEGWKEGVRMDEEVRWERRQLATLRRALMDVVGVLVAEVEDEDLDVPPDLEMRIRRDEQEEKTQEEKARLKEKKKARGEGDVWGCAGGAWDSR